MTFITKDSGQRDDFSTGARRDVQTGKPRYDLIPVAFLKKLALALSEDEYPDLRLDLVPVEPLLRVAQLYGRGAIKYGEGNFEKGIPFQRVIASKLRHTYQYIEGDRTEDHLAASVWNDFALMFYEWQIQRGLLPKELDDITPTAVVESKGT